MNDTSPPKRLRVLVGRYYPQANPNCTRFPVLRQTVTCPLPGIALEYLSVLADGLGMELEPVILPGNEDDIVPGNLGFFGKDTEYYNATMLEYIVNNTVDTVAMTYGAPNSEFDKHLDFTDPLFYSVGRVFVNVPDRFQSEYMTFFRTYTKETWIALAMALILQIFVGICVQRVEKRYDKCVIMMGVFSSYTFSYLIRPNVVSFQTVGEFLQLLDSGDYHLVDLRSQIYINTVLSKYGAAENISTEAIFKKNPIRYGKNNAEVLRMMDEPGAMMIKFSDDQLIFKVIQKCSIIFSDEIFLPTRAVMVFRRGSSLIPMVDRIISREYFKRKRIWMKYLGREWDRANQKCRRKQKSSSGSQPYFGLTFVVAISGLVSTVILLLELMYHIYDPMVSPEFRKRAISRAFSRNLNQQSVHI